MKTLQHSDELIDLGAISTETRGLEPIGKPDVEQGDHYPFGGGAISADDGRRAACRSRAARRLGKAMQ